MALGSCKHQTNAADQPPPRPGSLVACTRPPAGLREQLDVQCVVDAPVGGRAHLPVVLRRVLDDCDGERAGSPPAADDDDALRSCLQPNHQPNGLTTYLPTCLPALPVCPPAVRPPCLPVRPHAHP